MENFQAERNPQEAAEHGDEEDDAVNA